MKSLLTVSGSRESVIRELIVALFWGRFWNVQDFFMRGFLLVRLLPLSRYIDRYITRKVIKGLEGKKKSGYKIPVYS